MRRENKLNKVKFTVSEEFTYSRCRSCEMKILWFGIIEGEDELQLMHQNPTVDNKAYCPYCGKQKVYKENV